MPPPCPMSPCCGGCATITINASWTTCVGVTTTTGLFSVTGPASASQTGNGHATVTVGVAGTYSYTIGVTGYHTASGSFSVSCGDTHTISVAALIPLNQTIGTINPNGNADPFVTLVIKDNSGATISTGLAGSLGIPGSLPYTINLGGSIQPRYTSQTITISTISAACTSQTINVTAGTGYAYRCSCDTPISDTLHLSDRYGGGTLSWSGANSWWQGTGTVTGGSSPSTCVTHSGCSGITGSGVITYTVTCLANLNMGIKGQLVSGKWCVGGTGATQNAYSGLIITGGTVCPVATIGVSFTFTGSGCNLAAPFDGGAYTNGDVISITE